MVFGHVKKWFCTRRDHNSIERGTMKGIVLCGGEGTRLAPFTSYCNKHLALVYDKPMCFYPIQTLVEAGITDVAIVTGGSNSNGFFQLLKNGVELGLTNLTYKFQTGSGGIAQALGLCEDFADGEPVCVILGDNILEQSIKPYVEAFKSQNKGAKILLKPVTDPERFGVANLFSNGKVMSIVEKPENPMSNLAVIGVYFYDNSVFSKIKTLKPSKRNEIEVTDLNNAYINEGTLTSSVIDGFWTDAGTFESLLHASMLVAKV